MAVKIIRVQNCGECPIINKHCGFGDRSWCEKLNRTVCVHTLDSDCPLKDAPRWRRYPDEKPVVGNYLIRTEDMIGREFLYYTHFTGTDWSMTEYETVTHWMPIPEIGE